MSEDTETRLSVAMIDQDKHVGTGRRRLVLEWEWFWFNYALKFDFFVHNKWPNGDEDWWIGPLGIGLYA